MGNPDGSGQKFQGHWLAVRSFIWRFRARFVTDKNFYETFNLPLNNNRNSLVIKSENTTFENQSKLVEEPRVV